MMKGDSARTAPLWFCLYLNRLPIEIFERSALIQTDQNDDLVTENDRDKRDVSAKSSFDGIQAAPRLKPLDTTGQPIAIVGQHHIIMSNAIAAQSGIEPGMLTTHAYGMNESIHCIAQDTEQERQTLNQLAQWMYDFTPHVCILSNDSILLEVASCLKLFDGLDTLKTHIENRLFQLGYSAKIGISTTGLAAQVAAKNELPLHTIGSPISQLQHLSIHQLALQPADTDKLKKVGVATLGELVTLPRAALRKRLGQTATAHLERMIGERVDPHAWITPDIKFESSLFFTDNITSQKALLFPVKRLIQELTLFLTTRQLWTDSFTLTLSYRSKKQADVQVNLAQPDNDETLFLRLFQTRLERGLSSKETDQVSLKAHYFYPADPDNRSLFDQTLLDSNAWARRDLKEHPTQDQSNKHSGSRASNITKEPAKVSKEANNLISLLRSKLGDHACYGLSIEDDHRPEKSWKKTTQTRANASQRGTIPKRPNHRAQKGSDLLPSAMRPFFLLPQPRRLSRQYIPTEHPSFRYLRGPERISFGWWEGIEEDRDYYVYQYQNRSIYWIFYRPLNHRWYIHGVFA